MMPGGQQAPRAGRLIPQFRQIAELLQKRVFSKEQAGSRISQGHFKLLGVTQLPGPFPSTTGIGITAPCCQAFQHTVLLQLVEIVIGKAGLLDMEFFQMLGRGRGCRMTAHRPLWFIVLRLLIVFGVAFRRLLFGLRLLFRPPFFLSRQFGQQMQTTQANPDLGLFGLSTINDRQLPALGIDPQDILELIGTANRPAAE